MALDDTNRNVRSEEAARLLGIAEITLRKSRVTGILCGRTAPPYTKLGSVVIYNVEDLKRWLNESPKQTCSSQQTLKDVSASGKRGV